MIALALGIGADTAVFTIANGAFSWNLGLAHVDRVVLIATTDASGHQEFGTSYPDFRDMQSQARSFAALMAYRFGSVNLSDSEAFPQQYRSATMSASGFAVSEQKPLLGRVFVAADERPGAPAVVVLTYGVWQSRYGRDPSIVGKTIHINDVPATVIGVMPPGSFPEQVDLWMPLVQTAQLEQRTNRSVTLIGRLAKGVSMAEAATELNIVAARLAKQYSNIDKGLTINVQPVVEITGAYGTRPLMAALWAAIGFVLLIACADVANMLLARGAARMREIAIRVSVGAGRARIVRQLLVESTLLAVAGGFLGWLVALGGLRWFQAGTGKLPKPVWLNLSLDTTAFIYLAIISIGSGILFGLAPALRLSRVDVHTVMKDGGQGAAGGRRVLAISNLLIAFEMALCIVLLAGAGLMIHSAINAYDAPVGVNTANVLTIRLNLSRAKYPSAQDQIAFHRRLQARLDSIPGVESAAIASNLPFGRWLPFSYELEGTTVDPDHVPRIGGIVVSPAYFQVMHVKPHRGRTFTAGDGTAGSSVVIVNESFARKFWPGEQAVGKRLRLVKNRIAQPWLAVVGVVPDILQNFQHPLEHDPLIYLPYSEEPQREVFIVSRTHVAPGTLAAAFRRTIQRIDGDLPVSDVRTLEDRLARNRLSAALLGGMFTVFAVIALLLAVVGLYAVIAHSVTRRTREIGIRMAVGGTRRDIVRLVYAQGMLPMLWGIAFGLPAAFGLTHALRMVLIGVSPGDPVVFLFAVLLLVTAGVIGCAIPARRAIRVDPNVALRYE